MKWRARFFIALTVVIFLAACGGPRTILKLDGREADSNAPTSVASAFHSSAEAAAEADAVLASWETEPVSLAWTRIQLGRHVKHKTMPTRAARGLALVHVAMHDAGVLADAASLTETQRRLAISMAAADVLGYLYPVEERAFERIVFSIAERAGADPAGLGEESRRQAMTLGRQVAAKAIERGESDGAQRGWNGARLQFYGQGRYYGPGSWDPTPPYFYYPPDEPYAPRWTPWALNSQDEVRTAPPPFGSQQFLEALDEVIRVNREILATTPPSTDGQGDAPAPTPRDDRFRIAKVWVDGHGTVTPPGRWNLIAIDEVVSAKMSNRDALRLFAQLNIALADAFIACWDAKYAFWTVRPMTAAKDIRGIDLQPLVLTPPFPSYPSGHSTFSAAAAQILSAHFPDRRSAFEAMAAEAAVSRLYGGIHYNFDNDDGLVMGRRVADKVLERFPLR